MNNITNSDLPLNLFQPQGENNQDVLIKNVKNIGVFLMIVGILKFVAEIVLALLKFFNKNSSLSGNYIDTIFNTTIAIIYLIIGKKISKSVNQKTKKYLWSMTIITSILFVLVLFNGGKPYLYGFLLLDLIIGLLIIKKIR